MSFFDPSMEPMLDMFVFETTSLLEQLDEIMLLAEKEDNLSIENVNEIFRIMHTIKGSSAMMGVSSMSNLAHKIEDMFFIVRDNPEIIKTDISFIFDVIFKSSDHLKSEIEDVNDPDFTPTQRDDLVNEIVSIIDFLNNGETSGTPENTVSQDGDNSDGGTKKINANATRMKIVFDEEAGMENIRAFMLITKLADVCSEISSNPPEPETNPDASEIIKNNGFFVDFVTTCDNKAIEEIIESSVNVKSYEIVEDEEKEHEDEVNNNDVTNSNPESPQEKTTSLNKKINKSKNTKQSLISVKQDKLDQLMDVVGEIVIAESMVASNPDLKNLQLDNFYKSARQLRKLTDELQDIVMSIRMVPLSGVFQKMNRIVRDISKKLNKSVELITIGDNTEVDKTINDVIGDPFMHMVRNAVDHAIEMPSERIAKGKPEQGTVILEAQNVGGEIIITIKDDGKGLDAHGIYQKATDKGLISKAENEYTEKEIFNMIMLPGFSTKEQVTEFSGRGVGMDVVKKNLEKVGGSISVESQLGVGTTFIIRIPLTLAIVDGMTFSVGKSVFTIPITSIKESFRISDQTPLLKDTADLEMIMVREECLPIIRMYKTYGIETEITNFENGILIIVENDDKVACIFVDELIGEQQVVVKPFPSYISQFEIKDKGLAGCTILGDGSISLILDVNSLVNQ